MKSSSDSPPPDDAPTSDTKTGSRVEEPVVKDAFAEFDE